MTGGARIQLTHCGWRQQYESLYESLLEPELAFSFDVDVSSTTSIYTHNDIINVDELLPLTPQSKGRPRPCMPIYYV